MLTFKQARFVTSALTPEEFPVLKTPQGALLPEIALVGRSNVGKSSLINALFKDSKVAKTSSRPGKTQRILFFEIDQAALLVDLPGYGYAKAPRKAISEWSQAIDHYLNERKTIKLLLLLVDVRREWSAEDVSLKEWAEAKHIPLLVVFTKSDKLSNSEKRAREKEDFLFSNKDLGSRERLIRKINESLK